MLTQSTEKYQPILQSARQLFESEPDWVTFFREILGVDHFIMRCCQWPGLPQDQVLNSIRRLGEIFAS